MSAEKLVRRVERMQPGDTIEWPVPVRDKERRRDEYLAVNSAAARVIGKGGYTIRMPRKASACILTRTA